MSDFILYLKQRFHLGIFSLLTLFLLLFSKNNLIFGIEDVVNFIGLLFFLLIMRLYDDLQNSVADRKKGNRIYTISESKKKLGVVLIILMISYLCVLSFFNLELAKKTALFFGINHVLYLIFYRLYDFKSYLPLLKYPLVFIAINGNFNMTSIALFLAMIVFEILDDIDFSLSKKIGYAIACIAVTLLIPYFNLFFIILLAFILTIIAFIMSRRMQKSSYLFLLLFLLTRLTVLSYAI